MTTREVIRRLMISVNRIDGIYAKQAADRKIKANLIEFFYALDDGMPHSQKEICEKWMLPRSTLNTITRECIEKGYVTTEHITGRRREMYLRLTEAGQRYARSFLDDIYRREEAAFFASALEEEDIARLEDFCDALKASFEEK